jgi:hypothetical protein
MDRVSEILSRLKPIKTRESPFEHRLRDALKVEGIFFVRCKPTVVGFPDRLALGFRQTRLVEIKREDGELSDAQVIRHKELKNDYGIDVIVVNAMFGVEHAVVTIGRSLRHGRS